MLDIEGDDDDLDIEGIEEIYIEGPEGLNALFGNMGRAKSDRNFLGHLASHRIAPHAKIGPPLRQTMNRLQHIAKGLHGYLGRAEADELRRPNQWAGWYTTSLGPGVSVAVTITPSAGQPDYHFLGMWIDDTQAEDFGLSTLVIGGLPMILSGAQTAPVAPVANAIPMVGALLREAAGFLSIAPYTGRDFSNSVPLTFTIVNMTSDADSITRRSRGLLPVQADPCGGSGASAKAHAQLLKRNFHKQMRRFAAL